ncbi:MAG TPA: hypothetical protein VI278_00115 [Nitrososphaeraceae archaeon]
MSSISCKKEPCIIIWKWIQKYYSDLADDRIKTNRHSVKTIFVDETLLQIDDGWPDYYYHYYWLWIAYEPNLDSYLMMHLSLEGTIFVCYQSFMQLRKNRYGNKPIFTHRRC